jgi:leucyl-tRNA synthetase
MEESEKISLDSYQMFLKILAPFAPHLAEELWHELKNKKSIFLEKWPSYDPKLTKDETINLVVQINGKLRDTIAVPNDISEEEAQKEALNSEKVKKWLEGQEIIKVIFVKGKLINIVVK